MLNTLILRFSNLVIIAFVAHIVALHDFGVYAVAVTAYSIIFALGTLGAASCLVRADLDIDSLAPTMVTVSLVICAMLAGAMAAFAPHIAAALGSADGTGPVRVMALAMFLEGVMAVPWAQLTRDFRQDKIFLANAISFVPSTAVLLVLAKLGAGAMAFAWSKVVNQFVMDCMLFISVSKVYRPGVARSALSTLIRFGLPLAGGSFISYILLNSDNVFIGHLIGPVGLGIYVLAFNVACWLGVLVVGTTRSVSMPAFSRVKHDPDRLKNAIARALRLISVIVMPACGFMIALARPLVLTLYGAKWAASAEVLSILSIYALISVFCTLIDTILVSLGKATSNLAIRLLWLCSLIPAMALGVHMAGIVGAAVVHIIVIAGLILPAYMFVLRRATGVHFARLGKVILPSLLAASTAALAARGVASQFAIPLMQLITGSAAGGLVYVIIAAPECVAFLSQDQTAKLRALRLFRLYNIVVHMVPLVRGGPMRRRKGGRHRKDMDPA